MSSASRRRATGRPTRVLLLSQWFDPEPTFKGILFAKKLRELGFDVRVVTGFPNYPGGKLYPGYRVRLFQRELIDGIPVLRVPLYPSHDNSKVGRVLNYGSFALSAAFAVLFIRRPDVAYVYHPPATIALAAWSLKLFRGVPFVYDVQDLWPDTLEATGLIERPSLLKMIGRITSRIYKSATRVVVLSPGFKQAIHERGVPEAKIEIVPNWADEDQIDVSAPRTPTPEAQFTVTFAGNLGPGQALDTVLDSAGLLADESRVKFRFVGGGLEVERLRDEAKRRELTNVEFLPRRPINEIGEILASADVLLVHLKDDPLFAITIPSKTQAYLMAGRPILMGVRGNAAQMVEKAGAGIVFEPENSQSLADGVRLLLAMSPKQRDAMGCAGRDYYRESLSLDVGSRSFARILEEVSFTHPRANLVKRIFDIVASALGLIVLSIPLAVVAVLVRWKIGRPVLFRQIRPGRDAEPINMFKFRTMTDERNADGELLLDKERLTKFGAFLRASSLDEIPELWNVFRGDMSLVGPRPLLMRYSKYFTEEERLRFRVRPGITGWAQVNGRNSASWTQRLAFDVWYVKNLSLWLDLKILVLTVVKVVKRDGVVVDAESTMQNLDDEREGEAITR